jgi:ATP-dependent Clp protease ATP-binding subunit ClpC
MMMCSVCKENFAVVFITKIIDGKQTQEGLCLTCARKQGIQPINQLIEQTGMTEDDIDNLNKQVGSLFESMDMDNPGVLPASHSQSKPINPFFNLINKAFSKNDDGSESIPDQRDVPDDKESRNNTRTKTQEKKNLKKKKYLDQYGRF